MDFNLEHLSWQDEAKSLEKLLLIEVGLLKPGVVVWDAPTKDGGCLGNSRFFFQVFSASETTSKIIEMEHMFMTSQIFVALNLFKGSFVEFLKHTGWMPQVQEVLQRWNQAAESWEVEWKVPFHQDSKHPKLSSSLIAEFFTKKGLLILRQGCVLFMYSLYIQV